jgi:hypothetical protein
MTFKKYKGVFIEYAPTWRDVRKSRERKVVVRIRERRMLSRQIRVEQSSAKNTLIPFSTTLLLLLLLQFSLLLLLLSLLLLLLLPLLLLSLVLLLLLFPLLQMPLLSVGIAVIDTKIESNTLNIAAVVVSWLRLLKILLLLQLVWSLMWCCCCWFSRHATS